MLPSTIALNQTPAPQSQASQEVHGLPELVRTVLMHLGTDDPDPGAACKAVADFCAVDRAHRTACQAVGDPTDERNPWRVVTERVFRSTEQDRLLFAHDALLATDPKAAFQQACLDRQLAHATGIDWLRHSLGSMHRTLYWEWADSNDDPDGGPPRAETYVDEEVAAIEIMDDFYEDNLILCKVTEWRAVLRDEYEYAFKPAVTQMYRLEVKRKLPVHDGTGNWIGEAAFGRDYAYQFRDTSLRAILHGHGDPYSNWLAPRPRPFLAARFAHVERRMRALAARVGRAVVWAYHKDKTRRSLPGCNEVLAYLAFEPGVSR